MRLVDIKVSTPADTVRVTGTIERQRTGDRIELYFGYRVPDATFVDTAADPFATALLLPSMASDEPLEIVPSLSPRLHFSLPRIRDIFHTWWPQFARIQIQTSPESSISGTVPNRMATFFSGGVDSFYSLLKHRHGKGTVPAPLTHVIFMRGVETPLELIKGVEESESWVREIAAEVGVQCIFGESNIRTILKTPGLHFVHHYHGSVLAAVALTLAPGFGYLCIPSAFSYNYLIAHGSTPLADEMYSTEHLNLLHDGSEMTRPTKLARILEWDRELVLTHLRVCLKNAGGAFNCGKCIKCVRTAIPLRALGVLDQARTFPDKSHDHWEQTIASDYPALTEENLRFAREHGGDAQLVSMLERVLRRQQRRQALIAFVKNSPARRLLPAVRRLRAHLVRPET